MNCRNCKKPKTVTKIRIPNFGEGNVWYKAVAGFDGAVHTDSNGKSYTFSETKAIEAPKELQKHIYTIYVVEPPVQPTKEEIKEEEKKGGNK